MHIFRRASAPLTAICLSAALAFGGTVSPQLQTMQPTQSIQVIVQPSSSLLGVLTGTLCGVLNLIDILPLGELCTMTVADAMNLAKNPAVAHISLNNSLIGTGSAFPSYDYTPETIEPTSTSATSANLNLGKNIGVAVIDSGIHVNQDLVGGNGGLLASLLLPEVSYAESFVSGEGTDDYYGHGTHIAGIIAGNGNLSYGSGYLHDIHGIAPGAHLLNLKVLDKNGQSTDAQVIKAIDRAIQL